jgi:hypothetical protein
MNTAAKRSIDIITGILLLGTGGTAAWGCYSWLFDPFFSFFIVHHWWFWCVGIAGTIAALSAMGLFCWTRPSALVGGLAEFILAILLVQFDHLVAMALLLVVVLVYWRFLWPKRAVETDAMV